jgi:hypothetical protein
MIRVRIELVPQGDERRARLLVEGRIVNIGGDVERGHYRVTLSERDRPNDVWLTGTVNGFLRSRGPWSLLRTALDATMGKADRASRAVR